MEGPFEAEYGYSVPFLQGFSSLIFWGFCTSFLDLSGTALHGTGVLVERTRLSYVADSWAVTRNRVRRFCSLEPVQRKHSWGRL